MKPSSSGRRAELARLRASWGGVQMHRDRRIVLVAGEPGIGKTRLAHQFASAALAEGATVLVGRCSEEPLAPFEPFTEALAQAGAADALQPGDTDDVGARHRLFDAVDSALTDLAARAPLLLVIDDFHWADRGTPAAHELSAALEPPGTDAGARHVSRHRARPAHPAHRCAGRAEAQRRA